MQTPVPTLSDSKNDDRRLDWPWLFASLVLVVIIALGLRLGTQIVHKPNQYDERFITAPINDIITQGWSIRTAIDFKETKGPGLIWPYAAMGQLIGGDLNSLRLISLGFFILGAVPVLLIAQLCGLRGVRLLLVAIFYCLLPYNVVLGQLVMSEPSFIFGSAMLVLSFLWGFGGVMGRGHRVAGPTMFAIILFILLHNRLHAAAFAGAACLVALERDRLQSWPWWLACLLAGLGRLPLWIRWGGPVHQDYSMMHSMGARFDSLTYIAAAFVPFTILFLWPGLFGDTHRRSRMFVGAGALVGLGLAVFAPAALQERIAVSFDGEQFDAELFQGVIATFVRKVASIGPLADHATLVMNLMIGGLAILGLASVGALAALAWRRSLRSENPSTVNFTIASQLASSVVLRLHVWTFMCGWSLYGLTGGYVFDRYLMGWAALLPIAWVLLLPRSALALQAAAMLVIAAWQVRTYLM